MTNYEKNKEWFDEHELGIKLCGRAFSVDRETQKPVFCHDIYCSECEFGRYCTGETKEKWLKAEAKENTVNWDGIEKDTLIEVTYGGKWCKRYFSHYKDGKVHYFSDGKTSKTTQCTFFKPMHEVRLCIDERGEV